MLPTGQVGFLPDSYNICLASGAFDYSLLKILGPYDPTSPVLPPTFLTTLASVYVVDSLLPPLIKMSVTQNFPLYTFYLGILMTINSFCPISVCDFSKLCSWFFPVALMIARQED